MKTVMSKFLADPTLLGEDGPTFSDPVNYNFSRSRAPSNDLTIGEDAHDGYPGGIPSSTEVHGTGGDDNIDHFEVGIAQRIYGFAGDDNITAGYSDDTIFGGLGDDTILANAGDDVAVGGDGDDFILGGAGNDSLHTGEGADQVFGGQGDDFVFLVDDGQVDNIYFNAGDDFDVIDNFELGVDQVNLGNFGFNSFAEIEALITYSGDQAMLSLGNGDTIIFTGLDGTLSESDFVF
jgi:Ca2+-binding RTX toxin-like protein